MTDSSTPCFKSGPAKRVVFLLWFCLLLAGGLARAQVATEISQLRIERSDNEWHVSAQAQFELPPSVEDALIKGIAMVFVFSADVVKERWYWYDLRVTSTERHMRLAYQPLTRRWRLNISSSAAASSGVGLAFSQYFDTLPQALSVIKRLSKWQVADQSELDPEGRYKLDFRFKLDLAQLPRPFSIGAIGQSDWDISASASIPLAPEPTQ